MNRKHIFHKQEEALTNIQFVSQSERNDAYDDLAAGAGGSFRYLKMFHNEDSYARITKVGLLRSPKHTYVYADRKDYGWDECTQDINAGKEGSSGSSDWLHLCWNLVSTAYAF